MYILPYHNFSQSFLYLCYYYWYLKRFLTYIYVNFVTNMSILFLCSITCSVICIANTWPTDSEWLASCSSVLQHLAQILKYSSTIIIVYGVCFLLCLQCRYPNFDMLTFFGKYSCIFSFLLSSFFSITHLLGW